MALDDVSWNDRAAPGSRLGKQIAEVTAALNTIGARFALMGGLALASSKVVRATQDIDLLTEAEMAGANDTQKVPQIDPPQDFSYVICLTGYTVGLVVPADSPWKTLQDCVDFAKKNPGKVDHGSTGTGASMPASCVCSRSMAPRAQVPGRARVCEQFAVSQWLRPRRVIQCVAVSNLER